MIFRYNYFRLCKKKSKQFNSTKILIFINLFIEAYMIFSYI